MANPPGTAICYVADRNFMFPTLVSAVELRRRVAPSEAEIHILGFDIKMDMQDKVGKFCEDASIQFKPIERKVVPIFETDDYNRTHVPSTTLGRFFLDQFLPSHTNYILYLDGDTLINADPAVLVRYRAPPGKIGAAEDLSYFRQFDRSAIGERTRAYFSENGIDGGRGYFNAGVLSADRQTWSSICADALAYFQQNTKRCLFHDQSALNAVAGDRRLRLCPSWNFITHYRVWGLERRLPARLYHFAGGEKPWMGDIDPWREIAAKYRAFAQDLQHLDLPIPKLSRAHETGINRRAAMRKYGLQLIYRGRLNRYRLMVEEVIRTAEGAVVSRR